MRLPEIWTMRSAGAPVKGAVMGRAHGSSPWPKLGAVRRMVESRGGCCTPQSLIDAAFGDLDTNCGGTASADVHKSAPVETAQSLVSCRL